MVCPVCRQRKARRDCPALRQTICTVCCATKRRTEIDCPGDCPHLVAALVHPPALVRRQQERDAARLLPTITHLTERQHQLFYLFHAVVARHVPEGFARLTDDDVADAAAALAATLETASRGVIYDHPPHSLPAQRLVADLKEALEEMRQQRVKIYDAEAAIALRAIENGAREARKQEPGSPDTAYLDLMRRLLQLHLSPRKTDESRPGSALVLP